MGFRMGFEVDLSNALFRSHGQNYFIQDGKECIYMNLVEPLLDSTS